MNKLKTTNTFLLLIVLIIVVFMLKTLSFIFIPLILAIFLSFLLFPLLRFLNVKLKLPNFLSIIIVISLAFSVFYLIGILIFASSANVAKKIPKYQEKIVVHTEKIIDNFNKPGNKYYTEIHSYFKKNVKISKLWEQISFSKLLQNITGSFIDFFSKLILTVIFMLFVLIGREKLVNKIENSKKNNSEKIVLLMKKMEKTIITYFANKTIISIGTSITGMLSVYFIGIDFVLFSGILLFLFNYIPNIGSILASLFPIIICFLDYGFSWQLISIIVSLMIIQTIFGTILEPILLGVNFNISPIFILFFLIFWGWIWGVIGMFIAIPIFLFIILIMKEKHIGKNLLFYIEN